VSRVAFLGLGAMGRPMARRLAEAGHDVRVWNRSPGRDADLLATGATAARTPAEAASGVGVAITMLADPAALEAVLFGPNGVAETLAPDAALVEMSTVGPSAVLDVAARLAPRAVLDAPVLGSVPQATAGALQILVGGDPAVLARHAELLGALGTVRHVGGPGAGAAVKLVANAATISALAGLGELLAFTDRAGIDGGAVLDALASGPLASFVERWRGRIEAPPPAADFRLALARKDLGLVLDEAGRVGIRAGVAEAAIRRLDEAAAAGLGDADLGAVVAAVRA
jgi:3-hydroxyisobutyrate dehydrogenase-like beta-hydroxyacid dehydrogenase